LLVQLSQLFRSLRQEKIFTDANFRLIRRVGVAVLVIWAGNYASNIQKYFLGLSLPSLWVQLEAKLDKVPLWPKMIQIGVDTSTQNVLWPFNWTLVTGILVVIFSEIFRRGLRLQKEQDLTI